MKWYKSAAVIAALCLGLFGYSNISGQAVAQGNTAEKITVLNPLGHPPPITLKTMAPRLNTLEGKTIYLVDNGYVGSDNLLHEIQDWFKENLPKTETVFRRKGVSGFETEDPELWAEIKEKADGVIIILGH
jgi:tryptophan synthase alpha subunit